MIRLLAGIAAIWPIVGQAQVLDFPSNATLQAERAEDLDSFALATGPWHDGVVPARTVEGSMTQQAWHIRAPGLTTLQLMRPLRVQLSEAGYDEVFTCDTEDCGGFDFRFSRDVMPPPAMQVDLGDFRYLAATKDDAAVVLLVSRSAHTGFVQMTYVGPAQDTAVTTDAPAMRTAVERGSFTEMLETEGRAILDGLTFETGSSRLSAGPFASLQSLADYLAENTNREVALVGHTDSAGSLDGNIALSKRRAGAVLERLITDYGTARRQLDAQGMGYLSPIANNATQEGRDANRRVEVIITSTQ